ncbi:MAG: autotransporter outer membrane beta-barrel domain-containing protein [Verrucomicrobiales bacterium]|jgi:outer membrane autotransporter protein|nr:autotransporter outer membrane beta-barrel domain-containing protein [Verrucomicrobiales bacterium]
MKTPIIKLLTLTVNIITLPLTLSASITGNTGTNIAITAGSGTSQSGVTFDNSGNTTSPISVSTTGWYDGTRATIIASGTSGNGRNGVTIATGGTVSLTDSTINATLYGVSTSGTSTVTLNNTDITTSESGVNLSSASRATLDGVSINAYNIGVNVNSTSTAMLNNVSIVTEGTNGSGINLSGSSAATINNVNISTRGYNGTGINVTNAAILTSVGVSIATTGSGAGGYAIQMYSTADISDVQVTTQGDYARGATVNAYIRNGGTTAATVSNAQFTTSGYNAIGFSLGCSIAGAGSITDTNGYAILRMDNVIINASGNGLNISPGISSTTSGVIINYQAELIDVAINSQRFGIASDTTFTPNLLNMDNWNADTMTNSEWILERSTVTGAAGLIMLNTELSGTNAAGEKISLDYFANMTVSASASILRGDISVSGSKANLNLFLNGSILTGASTVADSATLNITLDNNTNWKMTGRSKVTTLRGANDAVITIANVEGEDLSVSGGISGKTALNLTLSNSVKGRRAIQVVVDESESMGGDAFSLDNTISNGMQTYGLENRVDGAWLVLGGGAGGGFTGSGDAVLNSAAAASGFWFAQLDNLHKRMGELRYNKPAGGDLLNNIWVRAYGQQINANTGVFGVRGFSETQYGVDLGTDYLWKLNADNQLYTGLFAGYGGAERDFHTSYSGDTSSGCGGLYATWLNNSGWYADAVAKGQYFRNEFSGADRGGYGSVGVGISVEFGRQFKFKDDWFIEPSVQASYLHLMNDSYTTRDGMSVTLGDADVLHIHGGARFGRNIRLGNNGQLQPHLKFGGLTQLSSGNKVTVSGEHWRPNLDGLRAVVGVGIAWQLNADSQLYFSYETSFGEKYDKPWGVNFGCRHQF